MARAHDLVSAFEHHPIIRGVRIGRVAHSSHPYTFHQEPAPDVGGQLEMFDRAVGLRRTDVSQRMLLQAEFERMPEPGNDAEEVTHQRHVAAVHRWFSAITTESKLRCGARVRL
jgi:hypothetical protein